MFWLIPALLAVVTLSARGGGQVQLTRDGEPRAAIVLPAEPHEHETSAANELREFIARISGAELTVVEVGNDLPADVLAIRLGGAADAALESAIREQGDSFSSFALFVDETGVNIRGLNPEGTLFGAYELLEQLGVRWFMPGELGMVFPESTAVDIAYQRTIQVPSMDWRQLQWLRYSVPADYSRRLRLGGERRSTGAHGLPGNPPRGTGRQTCLSGHHAPGALEAVVKSMRETLERNPDQKYFGMGPLDGGGYCQCDGCRELDGDSYDPLRDAPSMTDRYIWFFNRVLEELEPDYPDVHIAWYVYAAHMFPPEHNVPNPRIMSVFAPIDLDRTRGMDNPMSPDRHILRHVIDGWAAFEPNEMVYRGYYNNLACPQFPFSQIDRIRNEVPALHAKGVNAVRVEVIFQSWASTPLTPYLAARVWWDVDTDVDALLADYYEKFFGPAAEPMRRYFEDLESAFRDTPHHTGSSYLYFPIFDAQRRDTLRGHLERAAELAAGGRPGWFQRLRQTLGRADTAVDTAEKPSLYTERVRMISQGFERMELFLDMIAARNRHDYEAVETLKTAYLELTDALIDEGWVCSWEQRSGGYFNRFFRRTLESGYHRTVEAGDLVKGMDDEWDFLIDPAKIGEIAGYYRPGELGGNWQPFKTTSLSWSDQGLHYYKGEAWYRQTVTIPAKFEGRPIYLWFGGVDNAAKVWVNGQLLGTNREPKHGLPGEAGVFRPFDFLATEAVRFGEANTVSVKVTNDRLAELGTGGIVAPVMFWSPTDPDWQP